MIKPGIYSDIDIEKYHAGDGISKSALSVFLECPEHYEFYLQCQKGEKSQEEKECFRKGRVFHQAILEPEKYGKLHIWDGKVRHGKEWDAFKEGLDCARDYVLKSEVAYIEQIKERLAKHELASALLSGCQGTEEESCYWYDNASGELCKCRPDRRRLDHPFIVDYKTTTCASPEYFSRDIAKFGYHIQAAMCIDGYKANGIEIEHFFFVAQEKTAPFTVEVYDIDKDAIAKGKEIYKNALLDIAQSKIEKHFKSYTNGKINTITLPAWAF